MLHRPWMQDGTAQYAIAPGSPEKDKTSKACSCSHGIAMFCTFLSFPLTFRSHHILPLRQKYLKNLTSALPGFRLRFGQLPVFACAEVTVLSCTEPESTCKAAQPARLPWIKERIFCLGAAKASWWLFTANFSSHDSLDSTEIQAGSETNSCLVHRPVMSWFQKLSLSWSPKYLKVISAITARSWWVEIFSGFFSSFLVGLVWVLFGFLNTVMKTIIFVFGVKPWKHEWKVPAASLAVIYDKETAQESKWNSLF